MSYPYANSTKSRDLRPRARFLPAARAGANSADDSTTRGRPARCPKARMKEKPQAGGARQRIEGAEHPAHVPEARSGGPFRIQGSSVTDLAAVKRFGGNKGLRFATCANGKGQPIRRRNQTLGAREAFTAAKTVTFGMLFGAVSRRRRILRLGYRARQPEATLPAIAAWDHPDVPHRQRRRHGGAFHRHGLPSPPRMAATRPRISLYWEAKPSAR